MALPPQDVEQHIQQIQHDRRMLVVALSWGLVLALLSHLFWVGMLHRTFPSSYTLRKAIDGFFFLVGSFASMFIYSKIPESSRMFTRFASFVIAALSVIVLFWFQI